MPFFKNKKEDTHKACLDAKSALERIKLRAHEAATDLTETVTQKHTLVDITIQFIGADGLPKMDVVGSADPYFVATIDDKIKFTCVHRVALN